MLNNKVKTEPAQINAASETELDTWRQRELDGN